MRIFLCNHQFAFFRGHLVAFGRLAHLTGKPTKQFHADYQ